jgi:acyl-coenzyme A thioesterase PaaI-like protein
MTTSPASPTPPIPPTRPPLNETLYPEGTCIGCGPRNPHGFHLEVWRDDAHSDRLLGRFEVPRYATGLPGIAHGGAIYIVCDCLASWTQLILRGERRRAPILQSATMTYHRRVHTGQTLWLTGTIVRETAPGEPLTVGIEARDAEGVLVARGEFLVHQLTMPKFKHVVGLDHVPAEWAGFLEE